MSQGIITFAQPDATGAFTIVQGDDYKAADGRAFVWTNAPGTWPNLTGATITFVCGKGAFTKAYGPWSATSPNPNGANQTVQLELPAADTIQLNASVGVYDSYNYSLSAVLTNGDTVTLAEGQLTVLSK